MRLLLALLLASHLKRPPGATNPAVRQSTIHTTICTVGYATKVRPPYTWTGPLKHGWTAQAHVKASQYQLDHELPLELGGAPRNPKNLWLEPLTEAHQKDRVENAAHKAICNGTIGLRAAQRAMVKDWRALGTQLGVKLSS